MIQLRHKFAIPHNIQILAMIFIIMAECLVTPAHSQQIAREGTQPPIVYVSDKEYPPFAFMDNGRPTGFSVELMQAIGKVINRKVTIRLAPWTKVLPDLRDGKIDVVDAANVELRRKEFDCSLPIAQLHFVLFVRNKSSIHSLNDAKGKTLLVENGDIIHSFLKSTHFTSHIVPVATPLDELRLLDSGRYDGAFVPRVQGLYYMRKYGFRNIHPISAGFDPVDFSFIVKKGNTALLRDIDEGLGVLKQNGTYGKIYDKWFGVYEQRSTYHRLRYYVYAFLLMIGLVVISFAWSWCLRSQVKNRTAELAEEIQHRRDAEYALRAQRRELRDYINQLTTLTGKIALDGTLLMANAAAVKLSGCSLDQLIGQKFWETPFWDSEEARVRLREAIKDAASGKSVRFEASHPTPAGDRMHVEFSLTPVMDETNHVLYFVAEGSDITDRKRAENALRESEEKFRALAENAESIIFIIQGTKFIYTNPYFSRLTDYTSEEFQSMEAIQMTHPDYRALVLDRVSRRLIGEDVTSHYEFKMVGKTGNEIWIDYYGTRIEYKGMPAVVGVGYDITQRKQADAEKRAFYRETILSATDGKLDIRDKEDLDDYLTEAQIVREVHAPSDLGTMRSEIERFCGQHGLIDTRLDNFMLGFGEAVDNAFKHANGGHVYAYADDEHLWVAVSDNGTGIESLILPRAVLRRGFSTKPSLGLGYSIMLQVADHILLSTGKSGTTVVLVKNLRDDHKSLLDSIPDTWEGIADLT